jgi:hypothetical protein
MRDVILALDPGQTTGWALVRRRDKAVLGMGDLSALDVGCGIDLLIRSMHRLGYSLSVVVEQMPTPNGVGGSLAIELEFVRRSIDHWCADVFELPVTYVLPGVWKTSAVAKTVTPPAEWNCRSCSQHMKDAYLMATFFARKRS